MKAVRYHEFGGPEVLRYENVLDPEPGPDDVLVDVVACAVGRLDVLLREGSFMLSGFNLPHIAGTSIAGVISEVGAAVQHLKLGDRVVVNPISNDHRHKGCVVLGANVPGGYAERCLVAASNVYLVPHAISLDAASVFWCSLMPDSSEPDNFELDNFGLAWEAFCVSDNTSLIHAVFALADAAQAHREMLLEECVGKIILKP
ncbi:MAG: alcohol dehydrogenase catalytic domain-containing protein [Acidimicrobiia bacterium]|nr:alcohol dehydrogenase catalytic domain-containing protein [Acidimicrobiia bacterium]MYC57258.1 alcohol dehydrogenase catalytic domain-containing protein [Acidimicrobiia bacterium]MYG94462.1 alcohol dehydrogenase catalytic domain-containing protein [Acidimicrobiia bacterium]MYI30952.1 alcohol dehydrogenase catalytic domain-containing protein [Acidimicrobiia bacterium]